MVRRCVIVAIACAPLLGCGVAARQAARQIPKAVPTLADETLKVMEDPETQPRVDAVLHDAGGSFVAGAIETAASDAQTDQLRRLVLRILGIIGPSLESETRRLARTAARGIADEIPASLGPALGQSITIELSSPELRKSLEDVMHDLSIAAVHGSKDALTNPKEQGKPSLMERMRSYVILTFALAVTAVALALGVIAWGLRMRRRASRYRRALVDAIAEDKSRDSAEVRRLLEALVQ
jgi:hypothetical protein